MTPNPLLDQALRRGARTCLLCYIDHPDGEVRVWSRTGTLSYDGHEWQGLGVLGRISGVAASSRLSIRQVSLELSGVPPHATRFLSARVRNRFARVWFAALKGRRICAPPDLVMEARLDYQTLKTEKNGLCTIRLIGNVGLWTLDRASQLSWTHEQQIRDYPDDSGLSLMHELTQKEVRWRQA